jgi:hypothetical protein
MDVLNSPNTSKAEYTISTATTSDNDNWHDICLSRIKSLWKELLLIVFWNAFRINLERKNLCMITTLPSCPGRSPEQEQQDYGLLYRAAYAYTYVLSSVLMPVLMPLLYAWEILASLFRSAKRRSKDMLLVSLRHPKRRWLSSQLTGSARWLVSWSPCLASPAWFIS